MKIDLNEEFVEDNAHQLFDDLEYETTTGSQIDSNGERQNTGDVILEKRLLHNLEKINPGLPHDVYLEAISKLHSIPKNDIMVGNRNFHKLLLDGFIKNIPDKNGKEIPVEINYVDWKTPKNNDFLAVRQLTIQQHEERRPDHVIFLNGIPIVIIEYKSPFGGAELQDAYDQLGKTNYQRVIPKLFCYNAFTVISNWRFTKYGTFESPPEFFFNWYDKDDPGSESEPERTGRFELFINDVFEKENLLNIISFFIEYEDDGKNIIKKIGRKHQIQGVNKLVTKAEEIYGTEEKRIGTVFHGTGSGKSMSMIFFAEAMYRSTKLENPTIIVITDRNDLDEQLSDFFKVAGFPIPKPTGQHGIIREAQSIDNLREELNIPAGNLIFTTIQKFQLKKEEKEEFKKIKQKAKYPVLSTRNNIILICDEAHRSQYRKIAQNLNRAFPNALRVGFTATPLEEGDRDTPETFGPIISTYTQSQSVKDGTTVEIQYEGRCLGQHIIKNIQEGFDEITESLNEEETEAVGKKWSDFVTLVEREERMKEIVKDMVFHFNEKKSVFPKGKAMLCASTKMAAARYYEYINEVENHPKCICVISSGTAKKNKTSEDEKKEKYLKDHYRTKQQAKDLVTEFKTEENDVELLIVCDMYLTGFDAPLVHTLYVDKPLRDHNLFQAASRVNRKSKPEKQVGFVIDYVGIGDNLKKSFKSFNENDFKDIWKPIPEILEIMKIRHAELLSFFETPIENRHELEGLELVELIESLANEVLETEELKLKYFKLVAELTKAYNVCTPNEACLDIEDDMVFFQKIRAYVGQSTTSAPHIPSEIDVKVGRLVDKGLKISDAFEKFTLNYDSEKFELNSENLKKIKEIKHKNLKLELANKLLDDAIKIKFKRNKVAQKLFQERLEKALSNYHGRFVDFEKTMDTVVEVGNDVINKQKRTEELGLNDQEIVFYDAISAGKEYAKSDGVIVKIAKELHDSMKTSVSVDWLNQESIKATIRKKIKQILIKYDFPAESFEKLVPMVFQQVEANYTDMDFQ
ncbi:type I restriction endonuclease subunit R [Nitrosopumilus sp.]|nr:type I restriction endonuclease subunit R [Nitrosopumilus sp.]